MVGFSISFIDFEFSHYINLTFHSKINIWIRRWLLSFSMLNPISNKKQPYGVYGGGHI